MDFGRMVNVKVKAKSHGNVELIAKDNGLMTKWRVSSSATLRIKNYCLKLHSKIIRELLDFKINYL